MNEAHLERMLLSMKPAAPSAGLTQRVETELALQSMFRSAADTAPAARPKATRTTWHVPVAWAGMGAAAAALVLTLLPPRAETAPAFAVQQPASKPVMVNPNQATPVSTDRKVISTEEKGIVNLEGGQVMRQIIVRSVEFHRVIDPATGQQGILEVPKEEIISVPVKVQ